MSDEQKPLTCYSCTHSKGGIDNRLWCQKRAILADKFLADRLMADCPDGEREPGTDESERGK